MHDHSDAPEGVAGKWRCVWRFVCVCGGREVFMIMEASKILAAAAAGGPAAGDPHTALAMCVEANHDSKYAQSQALPGDQQIVYVICIQNSYDVIYLYFEKFKYRHDLGSGRFQLSDCTPKMPRNKSGYPEMCKIS